MYQEFFNLIDFPFNQFPNTEYYCNLENHQQSLDVLNVGLEVNDGIIKIIGKSGTGKSLLCRLFIEKISSNYLPVYIINPYFSYLELLQYILKELNISYADDDSATKLAKLLYIKASQLNAQHRKIVLIFDEAQYISKDGLEIIQIISNFECSTRAGHEFKSESILQADSSSEEFATSAKQKLCQIILVGSLDLDYKIAQSLHLLQRVSFSYTIKPLAKEQLESYIYHRLNKATKVHKNHGIVFSPKSINLIYKKTQGVPRLINIVCHKSLLLAYSLGTKNITQSIIKKAVNDTDSIVKNSFWKKVFSFTHKKSIHAKIEI